MSGPYPISWIRLGEGAPSEPGVYLRAPDVAGWLRDNDADGLAELLDDEAQWPATQVHAVGHLYFSTSNEAETDCERIGHHVCGPQTDVVRAVVERYGRVWAKDSDYYAAAEQLGIKEPPDA